MNGRNMMSLIRLPAKRNSSGLSAHRFASPIPEEFLCVICSKVAGQQLECHRCGALYCQECTLKVPRSKEPSRGNICIICDASIRLRPPSKVLKKIIGELQLNCKFTGCPEIVSLDLLYQHQAFCPFREVKCGNFRTCNSRGTTSEFLKVADHANRVFACSAKCKRKIELAEMVERKDKKHTLHLYRKLLKDLELTGPT